MPILSSSPGSPATPADGPITPAITCKDGWRGHCLGPVSPAPSNDRDGRHCQVHGFVSGRSFTSLRRFIDLGDGEWSFSSGEYVIALGDPERSSPSRERSVDLGDRERSFSSGVYVIDLGDVKSRFPSGEHFIGLSDSELGFPFWRALHRSRGLRTQLSIR